MSQVDDALDLRSVTKRFGSVTAVDDVSFGLDSGELLALVGPSGCGKSTLLRTIAGLDPIDDGSIVLNGVTVDDHRHHVPPEKRHIGLVFQEHALFPHLTVAANVGFGVRGVSRNESRARVADALELVDLAGYEHRYPHELSGGERQRIALARALAPRPALMLLDEPFASLDPNLRVQLRGHVVSALRATSTPAVFVTHDQHEALGVGDQVAVMRAGRIEQLDTPAVVFHKPANRFVAAFMGEASFLPITLGECGPSTSIGPLDTDGVPASGTVAMVRPDDLVFVPDPAADAEVVDAEFRGASWSCSVRLADGSLVLTTVSHLRAFPPGTVGRIELVPGHRPIAVPDE